MHSLQRAVLTALGALALAAAAHAASEGDIRKVFRLKEIQTMPVVMDASGYERVDAALGRKCSRASSETFYRAMKGGRSMGIIYAQTASWEGHAFEIAVMVSSEGRLEEAVALGAPPGLDAAILATLAKSRFDELGQKAPASALTDAVREGMLKIYAGPLRVADFASLAQAQREKRMPLEPLESYELLKTLMEDMMWNYKSAWFHLKRGNMGPFEEAVSHMAALAERIPRYDPKLHKEQKADFAKKAEMLRRSLQALLENQRKQADRGQAAKDMLDAYHQCQSCHETFAPAENAEKRNYAPEM